MISVVLATRNAHKVEELSAMLGELPLQILSFSDFPDMPDVVEDGASLEENAIKKAREVASFTGLPALADDTELLLVDPNNQVPKPNILMIIDSSGSMTTQETTKQPFDTTDDYSGFGTCDPNVLYWTDLDAVPSCDAANTKFVAKTSFLCAAAARQLGGIGIYTNKMTQYRVGDSGGFTKFFATGVPRWQALEPGNATDIVECQKDRKKHGDGIDGTLLYAQRGGGVAPYTDKKKDEVSWRSWPTSQSITVYDGNYLNYRTNTVTIQQSRIGIVQTTAKIILNSMDDVNVGIMRFNETQGGPVIHEIADLDTNRAAINAAVDSIVADGWTPVSEALYEAALYWRGENAYYGELVNDGRTDFIGPGGLQSTRERLLFQEL